MKLEQITQDAYYHIFNQGINGTRIFSSEENKRYFLKLTKSYLSGKITFLAYCLMDNHYHMLVRVTEDEKLVSQAFSNLFNAYAKAFNKQENRTGALFERPFKRKRIMEEDYLRNLIVYIHTNPENHGIIDDFRKYRFTSYPSFSKGNLPDVLTVEKEEVLNLFDNYDNMDLVHTQNLNKESGMYPDLTGFKDRSGLFKTERNIDLSIDFDMKDTFYDYIQNLQDTITAKLEEIDGNTKFKEDLWTRPEGGGGRSRVIENGAVFEKGGVNISAVHGELPQSMQNYFGVTDADFFACGLSLVIHPKNPMVPTVHANWRYFEMYDKQGNIVDQWFGGGQDLTPYYLFDEDATHFHSICKRACDAHHPRFYSKYKEKCDTYFWNTHRNEARGVGGLFFDYCRASEEMSMPDWFDFVSEVGDSFLEAYIPIVIKRKGLSYTPQQRDWQEIRRGRYVEFNLVHDKGTLFGLRTNGRIESILMSLPPHVQWRYDYHPRTGSEEERLLNILKTPREWV